MKNKTKLPNIFLGVVLALMFLPIVIVVIHSFNFGKSPAVWEGFSFKWYAALAKNREFRRGLKTSLTLATLSSVTAGVVGTLAAVGMPRLFFKPKKGIEQLSMLPIMIPEIVLGIVFLAFFTFLNISPGFGTLYIAHTSFSIPYVYTNVKARLVGLDPALEEAAKDLGASELRAFVNITLPLIMPAVISGMLLSFAMSMDDVVISIFLTSSRVNTLPIIIYTQLKAPHTPEINALCTLMLLATIVIMVLAALIRRINVRKHQPLPQEEVQP